MLNCIGRVELFIYQKGIEMFKKSRKETEMERIQAMFVVNSNKLTPGDRLMHDLDMVSMGLTTEQFTACSARFNKTFK